MLKCYGYFEVGLCEALISNEATGNQLPCQEWRKLLSFM